MTPGDLMQLTGALLLAALVCDPAAESGGSEAWLGLRRAARDLALNGAAATGLAALLLWLLPYWRTDGLWDMTLAELRQRSTDVTAWLQKAWYLPMAGGLLWLAVTLATGAALWGVRAAALGDSLGWALRLKALAGLLALFCLTATGLQSRAHQLVQAQQARVKDLAERRLVLANDAVRAALVAVAAPMAEAIAKAPVVAATAPAYWSAEPYLPVPAWPALKHGDALAAAAEVERRMNDLSSSQAQSADETLQAAHRRVPDETQRLVAVVVEAAFDQGVTEPVRDALLSIENPLLNELLAAALDPVVARPLREAVVRLAVGAVQGGGAAPLGPAAAAWWASAGAAVNRRWQRAVTRAQPAWGARSALPLGQPAWQAARGRLAELLAGQAGEPRRLGELSASAAAPAARRMARLWQALDALLVTQAMRQNQAERAAASLMLSTGVDPEGRAMTHYTALWGQALAETPAPRWPRKFNVLSNVSAGSADARAALLRYYADQGQTLREQAQKTFGGAAGGSPEALVSHATQPRIETRPTLQDPVRVTAPRVRGR